MRQNKKSAYLCGPSLAHHNQSLSNNDVLLCQYSTSIKPNHENPIPLMPIGLLVSLAQRKVFILCFYYVYIYVIIWIYSDILNHAIYQYLFFTCLWTSQIVPFTHYTWTLFYINVALTLCMMLYQNICFYPILLNVHLKVNTSLVVLLSITIELTTQQSALISVAVIIPLVCMIGRLIARLYNC